MLKSLNIAVIGLDTREDRWQRCEDIFKHNRITNVTRYITSEDPDNKHEKATIDFLAILEQNKDKDLLFFEDDFELVDGWRNIFIKAWNDLPPVWDMLYLGCNLRAAPKKKTDNLYRVMGAWMFHAVVLNKEWIKIILNDYDYKKAVCFDEWCRQQAGRRRFYMTYPMIAYQREGFSDYENKYIFYDIFNNKYYKNL